MKKKILHVVPTLKKDGAETQLVILLNELKKNDEFIELVTFDLFEEGESIESSLIDLDITIDVFNRNIFTTINSQFPFCFIHNTDYRYNLANMVFVCKKVEEKGKIYTDNKNNANNDYSELKIDIF